MTGTPADESAARVVAIMRVHAQRGLPAPANPDLAALLGIKSKSSATTILRHAERLGLLVVHRGNSSRVVSAPDGSWRTAGTVADKHWRDRTPEERATPRVRHRKTTRPPRHEHGAAAVAAAATRTRFGSRGAWSVTEMPRPAPVAAAPSVKPVFVMPVGIAWAYDKRGCRWPMWSHTERATHAYCDAPREDLCRPYCAAHRAKAARVIA